MTINKILTSVGLVVVLVIGIFIGHEFWARQGTLVGAVSPVGVSNTTPQIIQQSFTGAATTTWFTSLNTGPDRFITNIEFVYSGTASTSALTLQAATSTDSVDLNGNIDYIANFSTQTNTLYQYLSSTTPSTVIGVTTGGATNASTTVRVWPNGTYLNFVSSGLTTNGQGYIRVSYIQL